MMEKWKSCYLETRDKIEEIGKGNRWEFDKKKLFAETDHQSVVCRDLHEVATVSKAKAVINSFPINFHFIR